MPTVTILFCLKYISMMCEGEFENGAIFTAMQIKFYEHFTTAESDISQSFLFSQK